MSPLTVRCVALILSATALGIAPSSAANARLGAEIALDAEISCFAGEPRLAPLAGGGFVAVWITNGGLWARRFDDQGVPRFPQETRLASGSILYHQVVALEDGGFAVVWYDEAEQQILQRRADAEGRVGPPVDLTPPGEGSLISGLAAAAGPAGRIGVAFAHRGGGAFADTTFREFGADGTPSSPVVHAGGDWGGVLGSELDTIEPVVIAAPGGAYRVFWIDWFHIVGQPANPQGSIEGRLLSPPFLPDPEGETDVFILGPANSLAAAAAADGSYLLTWTTPPEPTAGTAAVWAQRFTPGDEPAGAPVALETGEAFTGAVEMASRPQGGFAVTWEGPAPPLQGFLQAYLRLVDADGSPAGAAEPIATPGVGGAAISPSLAFLANGQFFLAWNAASCDLCDPPPCFSGRLRAQRFAIGSSALSLGGGRFEATLSYFDPRRGLAGTGVAEAVTDDTGYFWFFSPSNLEVLVKVLDGRPLNGHFWVFWGGITDLGFRLTVRDKVTGESRTYESPVGTFASAADTDALPAGADASTATTGDDLQLQRFSTVGLDQQAFTAPAALADLVPEIAPSPLAPNGQQTDPGGGASPCTHPSLPVVPRPGLCLAGHRFDVEATWGEGTESGIAQPLPLSDDTGLFWFFSPGNVELVVKVLDGRGVNGRFWVFYGALTNVAYDLVVRHSVDGVEWQRHGAGGNFGSGGDTGALTPPACACPGVFEPVCGRDGRQYGNACEAYCFGWVGVDPTSTPPMCVNR